jgi:hypothetical protein
MRRRGSYFEAVTVPDRALAAVCCELEILGQLEAIGRAGILAKAAEHAAGGVVGKRSENFAPRSIVAQPADNDQVLRARQRAKIARDAERFAGFRIDIQTRRAAIPLRDHRALERVLLRTDILRRLIPKGKPHPFQQVQHQDAPPNLLHGLFFGRLPSNCYLRASLTSLLPRCQGAVAFFAIRVTASTLRSMSSSVVAQHETLTRIALFPCHSVPPHQHVPSF